MTTNFAWLAAFALFVQPHEDAGAKRREQVRQSVWAFERKLPKVPWPKDKVAENEKVVRGFFDALRDPDMKIEAIGMTDTRFVYHIPRELTSEILGRYLHDEDLKVRVRAAHALGYNGLGGKHFDAVVQVVRQVKEPRQLDPLIYCMTRSEDERFLPFLLPLLKHEDAQVRANVVFSMRTAPFRDRVMKHVAPLFNDPDARVRQAAVYFAEAADKLSEMLEDKDARVRGTALQHFELLKPGDTSHSAAVAKFLNDPSADVRIYAMRALARRKGMEQADAVAAFLGNDNVVLRRVAAIAMKDLAAPKHRPVLEKLIRDPDDQVRDYATAALKELAKREQK